MPKIPKKNISGVLHDVRPPADFAGRQPEPTPVRSVAAATPHVHQRVHIDSAAREEKISLIYPVAGTLARHALFGAGGRLCRGAER